MQLNNLKDPNQMVDYATAVKTGLGNNQGLFFPPKVPQLPNVNELLAMSTTARNFHILQPLVKANISDDALRSIIANVFTFQSPLKKINEQVACLELFHGPTLAFKDFGARFMANCLQHFSKQQQSSEKITILTATSGDTGAAVAHAFHGLDNIEVVILFPQGKISELQQKMFTTLSGNIRTVAVAGDFDDCQKLVKQSFDDVDLVRAVGLNSANSINVSRLFAQICYYFDAVAQLPVAQRDQCVVAVPSGNFGNLCAGIMAQTMGLPIKRFIASTNLNDTVPRYLKDGIWSPNDTVETLSNAMDVSKPNNWPRIEYMIESGQFARQDLSGLAVDEMQTENTLKTLYQMGYISEPHAAVAYQGLQDSLAEDELGIFLGTAHPAKFKSSVEAILNIELPLPDAIAECAEKTDLSTNMSADYVSLRNYILG
ncbi:threonine synthase [Marinicella sp. S1101]|uniref:threonine synthase n=1 Tax=Marinicella marina TaxID=2996016 RepID=UPI0022609E99|nr:threonine synthase [Marinicella marina]MCX7552382.1 threonine synthase [Marinicella marina]MDJ1139257.1 threonine synthase [Marinicella marina]